MPVDFDWAGVISKAVNFNKTDFWQPDNVSDGMSIKSEHDMAMLEDIFC
jgi:hypothetical protein